MKKILNLQVLFALLVAAAPLAATAQITTYFTDNFSNGSTTNGLSDRGGSPTASYTSYDIGSGKNTIPGTNGCTVSPNDLHLALAANTSSGWWEAQALFVTNAPGGINAIPLAQTNDYIDIVVVFTNTANLWAGSGSAVSLGLYYSGGHYPTNYPVPGTLAQSGQNGSAGSTNTVGNCASWAGYVGQIMSGGTTRIATRPVQVGATTSAAQELLFNGNTGNYANPGATVIATTPGNQSFTVTPGGTYTMELRVTVNGVNSLMISNILYSGAGTGTPPILVQTNAIATNATFLTAAFDGFAIGALQKNGTVDPIMDISSITITGTNTPVTGPPTITSQPLSVSVATNGSCAFSVSAIGFNVSYQWGRNGTNLIDAGNISGSKTSMLIVTNVGTVDELSTNNGYYVTVFGAAGYSTNSVTNSLTLIPATNLYYATGTWDVHNSANWDITDSGAGHYVFDYGDPVIFGNNGGGNVTLNGTYLSAASVTVSQSTSFLTWSAGGGSFAGPGNLICNGSAQFTINNVNTYSGGTIVSNSSAKLRVGNLSGLGTGPVTLAKAGGAMEFTVTGNASLGIPGDILLNDDFTMKFDPAGAFAGVFMGNFSGTSGKTLTLVPNSVYVYGNSVTNSRIRFYAGNTTNNANLSLDPDGSASPGSAMLTLASYNSSGNQTYNGVISGNGAYIQKGNLAYLNGDNTFAGGAYLAQGNIGLGLGTTGSPDSPTSGPLGTGPLFPWADSTSANPTGNGTLFSTVGGSTLTIANTIEYLSATNNVTLIIGGTNAINFTGSIHLAGLDLNNGYPSLYTNRTFQVTNAALTATFSGVIDDQANGASTNMGLIVSGSGVVALASSVTETYTGPTTVSGGTLQVNATLDPASAVTVASNATLSGTGTIGGPVTVNAGGALAPGAASIGALNLNNGLTMSGNIKVRVNNSGHISDNAVVTGALTNNGIGSVIVTNLGATLVVGDTFFLFNKALSNGAAMTVLGGNVAWNNKLAIDGSIQVIASPDIGVQETGAAATVALGLNMTNTITVTNLGPGSAYGIVVTNVLPNNATYASNIGGGTTNANPGQVVWSGITLAPNSYSNLTLVLRTTASGNATNIASTVSSAADPAPANNVATNITSVVQAIDTGVTNTGPASVQFGANIAYTVTVTNIGPGTASGIIVTDSLSPNVTFVSADNGGTTNANAGQVVWSGFNLAVNTKTNFTLNVIGAVSGNATNVTAGVGSALDTNLVNNTASWVTVIAQPADLGVSLAGLANAALGGGIAYTVTVTNSGPGAASGIIVTDALSAKVTFVSADNGGTTNANAGQVVWSGFNLAVNTGTNFTLNVLAAAGGNATNAASVVGATTDTNLVNNTASRVTVINSLIIPQESASIGSITLDGLNVVVSGTNGVNGGTYYLLGSTDAATPISQWQVMDTNTVSAFGALGIFTFTGHNVVTPNGTQQFYILSNTNNH